MYLKLFLAIFIPLIMFSGPQGSGIETYSYFTYQYYNLILTIINVYSYFRLKNNPLVQLRLTSKRQLLVRYIGISLLNGLAALLPLLPYILMNFSKYGLFLIYLPLIVLLSFSIALVCTQLFHLRNGLIIYLCIGVTYIVSMLIFDTYISTSIHDLLLMALGCIVLLGIYNTKSICIKEKLAIKPLTVATLTVWIALNYYLYAIGLDPCCFYPEMFIDEQMLFLYLILWLAPKVTLITFLIIPVLQQYKVLSYVLLYQHRISNAYFNLLKLLCIKYVLYSFVLLLFTTNINSFITYFIVNLCWLIIAYNLTLIFIEHIQGAYVYLIFTIAIYLGATPISSTPIVQSLVYTQYISIYLLIPLIICIFLYFIVIKRIQNKHYLEVL